jgi:hypothetical protein
MFYGLWCSPHHWYDQINAILWLIGLTPLFTDPCLYTDFIWDPSNTLFTLALAPLSLGLYVNKFVYFSEDPAVEALFCRLLAEHFKVDFLGIVEWFLGIHFFVVHHPFLSGGSSQPIRLHHQSG